MLSRALSATNELLKDFEARLVNAQSVHALPSSTNDDKSTSSRGNAEITLSSSPSGLMTDPVNKQKYIITHLYRDAKQHDKTRMQE